MPRSTPITVSAGDGVRSVRSTSQVKDTNQRPASRRTVAGFTTAVPAAIRRCSFRVDSCALIVPRTGSVTCLRSSSKRIVPVVNRTDGVVFRFDL